MTLNDNTEIVHSVTTQAREGIETPSSLPQNTLPLVTTQAREGIETR